MRMQLIKSLETAQVSLELSVPSLRPSRQWSRHVLGTAKRCNFFVVTITSLLRPCCPRRHHHRRPRPPSSCHPPSSNRPPPSSYSSRPRSTPSTCWRSPC